MGREKQNANLIPASDPKGHKLTVEEQSMGGKISAEKKAKKKERGEMWREFVNTRVTNEEMLQTLKELGINEDSPTYEQYIRAKVMKELLEKADIQDLQKLDDELYGPIVQKQKIEQTVIAPKPLIDLTERAKNGQE